MVLGSQQLPPSWDLYTQCLGFTESGLAKQKHPVTGISVAENNLVCERDRGRMAILVKDNRKATSTVRSGFSEQKNTSTLVVVLEAKVGPEIVGCT